MGAGAAAAAAATFPDPPLPPGFGQLREGGHVPGLAHAQKPDGSSADLEIPRTIETAARETRSVTLPRPIWDPRSVWLAHYEMAVLKEAREWLA